MFRKISNSVFGLFSNSSDVNEQSNDILRITPLISNKGSSDKKVESLKLNSKSSIVKDMRKEDSKRSRLEDSIIKPTVKRARLNITQDIAKFNIENTCSNDIPTSSTSMKHSFNFELPKSNLSFETSNSKPTTTASKLLRNFDTFDKEKDVKSRFNNSVKASFSLPRRKYKIDKAKDDKFVINRINENTSNIFSINSQIKQEIDSSFNLQKPSELDVPQSKLDFSSISRSLSSRNKPKEVSETKTTKQRTWNCSKCSQVNLVDYNFCPNCGHSNPLNSHVSGMRNKVRKYSNDINDFWNCERCKTKNKLSMYKCQCCFFEKYSTNFNLKPLNNQNITKDIKLKENFTTESKVDLDDIISTKATKSLYSFYKTISTSSQWNCPTCMVDNDNSVEKCVCCQTSKPKLSQASEPIKARLKFGSSDKWNCPTCMVDNDNSVEKCVCCQTSKPKSNQVSEPIKPRLKFGSCDKWNCPTCMVDNDNSVEKCACCQTSKPNIKNAVSSENNKFSVVPAIGSFKFISKETVKFGSTTSEPIKFGSTTSEPIKFGSTTNEPIKFGSTASEPFKFGSTASEPIKFGSITSEPIKFGRTTNELIKYGSTTSEPIKFGNTASELIKCDNKINGQITIGNTTSEPIKFGNTTSELIKFGNTTSEPIKFGNTTSEPIKFGNTTSESINLGNVSNESVKFSNTTSNGLPKDFDLNETDSLITLQWNFTDPLIEDEYSETAAAGGVDLKLDMCGDLEFDFVSPTFM